MHNTLSSVVSYLSIFEMLTLFSQCIDRTIYKIHSSSVYYMSHYIIDDSEQHSFLVSMINTVSSTITNKTITSICPKCISCVFG